MPLENAPFASILWPFPPTRSAHFAQAILHHHVASAESVLAEPGRLQRCLNVHFEIDQVRDELRVRLRLIPAAHDPERHPHISLLRKCGNDRMQRLFRPASAFGELGSMLKSPPRSCNAKPVPAATMPEPNPS